MLDNHGFDLWSDGYDASVRQSDESNQYPFAGYSALMNAIFGTIMKRAPSTVLDIGIGTALLASKLYDAGNQISGIDFSAEMLKTAAAKMPAAKLLHWDFSRGLPSALNGRSYDFIVSTYALHHLTDDAKAGFIASLLNLLNPKGTLLIGDVCFRTREELLQCKNTCGDSWDDEEFYFVFSELQEQLAAECRLTFHEYSFCSGVIEIRKKTASAN